MNTSGNRRKILGFSHALRPSSNLLDSVRNSKYYKSENTFLKSKYMLIVQARKVLVTSVFQYRVSYIHDIIKSPFKKMSRILSDQWQLSLTKQLVTT
jgi:hypothetical protein